MAEQANEALRLAVAGMGGRGVSMTGSILRSGLAVEVVGLVDSVAGRAELARDYHGLTVPCFDETARCLDETHPDALAVFTSDASNLVPDDVNGVSDVFLHDRQTHVTELISVTAAGGHLSAASSGAAVSGDGALIVKAWFARKEGWI